VLNNIKGIFEVNKR